MKFQQDSYYALLLTTYVIFFTILEPSEGKIVFFNVRNMLVNKWN